MANQPERLQSIRVCGAETDLEKIIAFLKIVQRNPADEDHKVSFALMNQAETVDWISFEANPLWRILKGEVSRAHK